MNPKNDGRRSLLIITSDHRLADYNIYYIYIMARKRKIISSLRGSKKKSKKSSSGSSRKYRTGRTRLRPEVKYKDLSTSIAIFNKKAATGNLSGSSWVKIINFPDQGTTDLTRIGDTIMGKKLYARFTIWGSTVNGANSSLVRIIIFNVKATPLVAGNAVNGFFQQAVDRPAFNGIVNREIVNKVFYDKQHRVVPPYASDEYSFKTSNINISMRWPIIFAGGSVIPKDSRNTLYVAAIGYSNNRVEDLSLGNLDVSTNFYFTDS